MEITRDARFQANLRLTNRDRSSSYVIAILSTFVIFISLVPNFLEVTTFQSQVLLSCSIILSVFIIFTSLLDGSSKFLHRGELLHASARGTEAILKDARVLDTNSPDFLEQFKSLKERYQQVLDDCPVNHDNIDYLKAKLQKPKHFVGRPYSENEWLYFFHRLWDQFRYRIESWGWLIPHIVAVLGICYVLFTLVIGVADKVADK